LDNKNPNPALGAFVAAALVAGVSLVAIIASEISEPDFTRPRRRVRGPGPSRPPRVNFAQVGRELLERNHVPEQTLNDFLRQKYLGLYLIGRSGEQIPDNRREVIAADLRHFHHQLDRHTDWAAVGWYETLGVSQTIPLSKLLKACPEVIDLQVEPRYIAFALGEDIEIDIPGTLTDIETLKERGLM
jgi:hypothetical protein